MPEPTFRGDPYRVLGIPRDATANEIKRRWRELAREHHPDRAAGDVPEQERLTSRMARINAAYDVLRDPVRRSRHDASPAARRAWEQDRAEGEPGSSGRRSAGRHGPETPAGPPPPPPSRPPRSCISVATMSTGLRSMPSLSVYLSVRSEPST